MKFVVMKCRIALAVMANCRAGGKRQKSMALLARSRGFYTCTGDLEKDCISWFKRMVRSNDAAKESLDWLLEVGRADAVIQPAFGDERQLVLSAA